MYNLIIKSRLILSDTVVLLNLTPCSQIELKSVAPVFVTSDFNIALKIVFLTLTPLKVPFLRPHLKLNIRWGL